MAAMVIVGVQPVGEGCGAFGFAEVGADVGPFLEQGSVESLRLAVGLGPVGPGPSVCDAERGQGVAPGGGVPVGPRVEFLRAVKRLGSV